ncbi:MAG: hypothetical protein V7K53_32650 [Nostoc sp.]|uniref:hypothetical protein n=1 Tax=Nostoc sp. TaxID=1180 RepID=UPI002FF6C2B6
MNVKTATPDDVPLIFSFIQKKAEFDRNLGEFFDVLRTSEQKIYKTLFISVPFSYVLFAENSEREVGFSKNDELMLLCISLILENMLRLNSPKLK